MERSSQRNLRAGRRGKVRCTCPTDRVRLPTPRGWFSHRRPACGTAYPRTLTLSKPQPWQEHPTASSSSQETASQVLPPLGMQVSLSHIRLTRAPSTLYRARRSPRRPSGSSTLSPSTRTSSSPSRTMTLAESQSTTTRTRSRTRPLPHARMQTQSSSVRVEVGGYWTRSLNTTKSRDRCGRRPEMGNPPDPPA